jgi:chemotaxis protein methyltransferase WspC
MALLDAGLGAERFQIRAVDISRKALGLGKRASYGRNSFRTKGLAFRRQYFHEINDRYEIVPAVRSRVRFQQGNLLAADFLSGESYDVIFCRNVLIYFDAPTQQRVLKTLARLVAPGGFLFVGASETFALRGTGFISAACAQAFVYRKGGHAEKVAAIRMMAPRRKAGPGAAAKPAAKPKPEKMPEVAAGDLEIARRLADAGHLMEAAKACEEHLRTSGASAAGFYLFGLVKDALGEQPEAADLYRKALYLEPAHVEALTHLGLLSAQRGDAATAKRLQLRARRAAEISTNGGHVE